SNIENDHYRVDINMNIKGSVLEYIGDLHLDSDKDRKKLEGLISKYITDEAQTMIDTMQENNVDSIGLGRYIRNSLTYKEWSSLNWDEVYPNIEVHCHAKVVIKDYGEFEK
ncbi:MAG TPA: Ger(x)C family spore germination C-terminal domain-containing protein, partial [Candidatus Paenibacillus intestinavium]|nr:Ger(x)C family spore germination C-terminal domain-containing protein [Candidatus Paenibacillus intestinavium]